MSRCNWYSWATGHWIKAAAVTDNYLTSSHVPQRKLCHCGCSRRGVPTVLFGLASPLAVHPRWAAIQPNPQLWICFSVSWTVEENFTSRLASSPANSSGCLCNSNTSRMHLLKKVIMPTKCRIDVTFCHKGKLGNCFLLHFPVGIPASLPFMAQLCCICDFVSPVLVVSLKCNKVSSGTTKHQRLLPTNRNSGSGVHSPTRLAAATPATSCVWWCFSVPFRPACWWRTLRAYMGLLCPNQGWLWGSIHYSSHMFCNHLLRLIHSLNIHPIQPVLYY